MTVSAPAPRKRFGQHFLHDPAVISRIVGAVGLHTHDRAVEIGPGHGALTAALLAAVERLDAVEIDRDLAAGLRARFAGRTGLIVHQCDALEFDYRALDHARGGKLRLIGNLPYNISTPLLFRLLAAAGSIIDMHFMLQKEVADRIVAVPGTAAYGRLGVMLAPFVSTSRLMQIGPGAFRPAPKVASTFLRLTVIAAPASWACTPLYGRVVSAAFAQRRKTLRNALAGLLAPEQIRSVRIDPGARAETLSPAQFGALAQAAAAVIH